MQKLEERKKGGRGRNGEVEARAHFYQVPTNVLPRKHTHTLIKIKSKHTKEYTNQQGSCSFRFLFLEQSMSLAPNASNVLKMEGDEEWERLNKCTSTIFQAMVQIQAHYRGKVCVMEKVSISQGFNLGRECKCGSGMVARCILVWLSIIIELGILGCGSKSSELSALRFLGIKQSF